MAGRKSTEDEKQEQEQDAFGDFDKYALGRDSEQPASKEEEEANQVNKNSIAGDDQEGGWQSQWIQCPGSIGIKWGRDWQTAFFMLPLWAPRLGLCLSQCGHIQWDVGANNNLEQFRDDGDDNNDESTGPSKPMHNGRGLWAAPRPVRMWIGLQGTAQRPVRAWIRARVLWGAAQSSLLHYWHRSSVSGPSSKLPANVPGTHDSSKVLLHDFEDLNLKALTKAGQQIFHHYIVILEAFPFQNSKKQLCWDSLIQAVKCSWKVCSRSCWSLLKATVGVSQVRGELMYKARTTVPHVYGLVRELENCTKLVFR